MSLFAYIAVVALAVLLWAVARMVAAVRRTRRRQQRLARQADVRMAAPRPLRRFDDPDEEEALLQLTPAVDLHAEVPAAEVLATATDESAVESTSHEASYDADEVSAPPQADVVLMPHVVIAPETVTAFEVVPESDADDHTQILEGHSEAVEEAFASAAMSVTAVDPEPLNAQQPTTALATAIKPAPLPMPLKSPRVGDRPDWEYFNKDMGDLSDPYSAPRRRPARAAHRLPAGRLTARKAAASGSGAHITQRESA